MMSDLWEDLSILFGPLAWAIVGMVIFGVVGLVVKKLVQRGRPDK
jgi:hypothetical protein